MISFVDDQRDIYGVGSICNVLPIAPSIHYAQLAVRADSTKASPRCQRDLELKPKIQKFWDDNWKVYGVLKASRQLRREGVDVARCTVARLMANMGLRGVVRGRAVKTTFPDSSTPCLLNAMSARQGEPPVPRICAKTCFGCLILPMSRLGKNLPMLPS